jgi:hypothetical protein
VVVVLLLTLVKMRVVSCKWSWETDPFIFRASPRDTGSQESFCLTIRLEEPSGEATGKPRPTDGD